MVSLAQDLPAQARKDKTRLLKKMQQELKARKDEEKWEKMALRYKKVWDVWRLSTARWYRDVGCAAR
jgi:hypothetical protein